ncbi:AbrB/MazE/SpoVT family DNA-binding domain-containing protein [Candidatus Pyrohabitans sp.]
MIAGKIYLPKEVRKKMNLSERGECEVAVGDEIRIRPVQPETLNSLRLLEKPGRG